MTLDALIMLSGVMVTLVPFLGFPLKWDNVILVVLGVLVITLGIIVRRRGLVRRSAIQTGNGVSQVGVPRPVEETHATE